MKRALSLFLALTLLAACDGMKPPVDLSNTAKRGAINIDGEMITVFKQDDGKWAAYGGENGDPQRYITYRKERAIELKSGCRIDKRISKATARIVIASVKCK